MDETRGEGIRLALSASDDLPFHQNPTPLSVPSTSDTHFNDGYYFAFYHDDYRFTCGLRLHPNNNVMDGHADLVYGGEQRSLRFSRELRPETATLAVGPLTVQIVEPMRVQRLTLASNEHDFEFDVEITASAGPFVEAPFVHYRQGRLANHLLRYVQVVRVKGTAKVDGVAVDVNDWYGCRNHSWGIRATMGSHTPIGGTTDDTTPDRRTYRLWVPFDLDDHSGFFQLDEDPEGEPLSFEGWIEFRDGSRKSLKGVKHNLTYRQGEDGHPVLRGIGPAPEGGSFTLIDEDGEERTYELDVVTDAGCTQAYGYARGWRDRGQIGLYRGPDVLEADRFPLQDYSIVPGPDHIPQEARIGGTNSAAKITGPGGVAGMAEIEHMVYRDHAPYGFRSKRTS